jgi:hypothetical protein
LKPHEAASAIHNAAAPRCDRFAGYYAIATGGEKPTATPIRCKSRRCSWCAKFVGLATYAVLADGIAKSQAAGCAVRFLTLTDTAEGGATVPEFSRSWQKLTQRLQRRGLLGDWAAVKEVQERGALHFHALMAEGERGGGFIPQADLSEMAAAVGFGSITDIRLVRPAGEPRALVEYLTKQAVTNEAMELARYCTKQTADRLADLGAQRVRPVNLSRSWKGGGIRAAERALMEHWYGRNDDAQFEVWHARDVGEQLHRLEAMERAATRLQLAA